MFPSTNFITEILKDMNVDWVSDADSILKMKSLQITPEILCSLQK